MLYMFLLWLISIRSICLSAKKIGKIVEKQNVRFLRNDKLDGYFNPRKKLNFVFLYLHATWLHLV